jgi:hypothetical protein
MRRSSEDVSAGARFAGVLGNGLAGDEVAIALDGKAELAAYRGQFHEADIAELLGPHPRALALRTRLKSVQNGSCRFIQARPGRDRKGFDRPAATVQLTAFDSPSPGEYMGGAAFAFERIAKSGRIDRGSRICVGRC